MTKKDLFRIIIKLFGLYVAVDVFVMLPETIIYLVYGYDLMMTIISVVTLLVVLTVLYVLIFKTDMIVELFRLEKGFDDEKINVNQIESESIIKISLIILSIFFIVDSIPDVITNIFYAFKNSFPQNTLDGLIETISPTRTDYYALTSSSIKLVLGFLMLTNKSRIARKMEKLN